MLNGRLAGADLIARISGFVPQQDLAIEDLTVAEHMEFMVSLYYTIPIQKNVEVVTYASLK